MSLNGKTLREPHWMNGKPYCPKCCGWVESPKPLTLVQERWEHRLYACVKCRELFRIPTKTALALMEIENIRKTLESVKTRKETVKATLETYRLAREVTKELDKIEQEIHSD